MNHEHGCDPARGNETNSRAKWVLIRFIVIVVFLTQASHPFPCRLPAEPFTTGMNNPVSVTYATVNALQQHI